MKVGNTVHVKVSQKDFFTQKDKQNKEISEKKDVKLMISTTATDTVTFTTILAKSVFSFLGRHIISIFHLCFEKSPAF